MQGGGEIARSALFNEPLPLIVLYLRQLVEYTKFSVAMYTLSCYTVLRRTNRERYHGGTYYGIQNWLCN